ncbi:hypothetical protein EYC80_007599 [Monilinia laxa]|uniref:Uncharacterized protein n=1 Tax=Monilinia laxa TaxID=61186 RepID=A0A5N6JWF4_MONLA|nr:hypothetical protein EYC80_007599 [Monilinia laxa]
MEAIDLDFKMVSPARADRNLSHMRSYKGRQMQPKWLGKLEDTKYYCNTRPKKFEIPPGENLSDIIRQIMAEPISEPRNAVDADDDKSPDRSDQGHRTGNRIGSNTTFRALPFSFSNIIVNSPYSQNRNIDRTRAFFSWLFVFINIFLAIALVYMIYDTALEHEESAASDVTQNSAILEDPLQ